MPNLNINEGFFRAGTLKCKTGDNEIKQQLTGFLIPDFEREGAGGRELVEGLAGGAEEGLGVGESIRGDQGAHEMQVRTF